MLDGIDLQVTGTDHSLGTVFDDGQNLVLRVDQCKGCTDAHGSSLAYTDAACTDCQLSLVGCGDFQITGRVQNASSLGCCTGQSLGSQYGESTTDGSLAVGSGDTACQSLGTQSTSVDAIHVCCVNCCNDNVFGSIRRSTVRHSGTNAAGIFCHGFIIINGNSNTGCNCEIGCGKGYGCRIGTRTEVCIVFSMEHHILRNQAADDKRMGLMLCDVDANRSRNLGSVAFVSGGCIFRTGGTCGDVGILLICAFRYARCSQRWQYPLR